MRGSELIGVMIARSEESFETHVGNAVGAQEIYRSISTSMGGVSVRPLTAPENAVNAHSRVKPTTESLHRLAVLRVSQLFD